MTPEALSSLLAPITAYAYDKPLDERLGASLDAAFPPDGEVIRAVTEACQEAIAEGWMCSREAGGIRYGRVLKPSPQTHGFSVDVVTMGEGAGPYHRHPSGEINLVMPVDGGARFEGRGAGFVVFGSETAHPPTATGGKVVVMYFLPGGAIDFTAQPA